MDESITRSPLVSAFNINFLGKNLLDMNIGATDRGENNKAVVFDL